jgi:hypothetical protein
MADDIDGPGLSPYLAGGDDWAGPADQAEAPPLDPAAVALAAIAEAPTGEADPVGQAYRSAPQTRRWPGWLTKRLVKRVALGTLALIIIGVSVTVLAIDRRERAGYYLEVNTPTLRLAIYQGKPKPYFWWHPTIYKLTGDKAIVMSVTNVDIDGIIRRSGSPRPLLNYLQSVDAQYEQQQAKLQQQARILAAEGAADPSIQASMAAVMHQLINANSAFVSATWPCLSAQKTCSADTDTILAGLGPYAQQVQSAEHTAGALKAGDVGSVVTAFQSCIADYSNWITQGKAALATNTWNNTTSVLSDAWSVRYGACLAYSNGAQDANVPGFSDPTPFNNLLAAFLKTTEQSV